MIVESLGTLKDIFHTACVFKYLDFCSIVKYKEMTRVHDNFSSDFSWLMMMWLKLFRDERLCLSRNSEIPTDVKVKIILNGICFFNVLVISLLSTFEGSERHISILQK